ncbi:hypothetical protein AB5V95_01340 [Metamycoplasma spumans]|uniref:hypothetical protein n=1 Tax=Metamycoplasma spumans TaxID=92406 RepID=UPI0034DCEB78
MKKESSYTPITEYLRSLGIEVQSSSVPQFKSFVERSFKTAQLNYPIFFKTKNIKHWTEISKIEDELINHFNSISPKLERNSDKNCFRKINEGDPGWYVDYHFKNKTHSGAVKYLNEYYAPVDTNGNRVNFSKKIKVLFCMNSSGEYFFKTPENRYKASSDLSNFNSQEIFLIGKNLDVWDDLAYKLSLIVVTHKSVVSTFTDKFNYLIRNLEKFKLNTSGLKEEMNHLKSMFKNAIKEVDNNLSEYFK